MTFLAPQLQGFSTDGPTSVVDLLFLELDVKDQSGLTLLRPGVPLWIIQPSSSRRDRRGVRRAGSAGVRSSAAPPSAWGLHCGGPRFESPQLHQEVPASGIGF